MFFVDFQLTKWVQTLVHNCGEYLDVVLLLG